MTRLRIDFAPPSLRRTLFRLSAALWGAGVLGLLLCLGAAAGACRFIEQRAVARQAQAAMARAVRVAPMPVSTPVPLAQAQAVNAAVRQLNLPWRDLREALAAATPSTVALLAFEPDAARGRLTISAQTRGGEAMLAYIERLKTQHAFSGALLVRHDVDERDPDRPLRFELQLDWTAP